MKRGKYILRRGKIMKGRENGSNVWRSGVWKSREGKEDVKMRSEERKIYSKKK